MTNKATSLLDYVVTKAFDIVALTETWLGSSIDKVCLAELLPAGYDIQSVPRLDGRQGGGVAVMYRNSLSLKLNSSHLDKPYTSFEYMECDTGTKDHVLKLGIVYRPPY